MHFYTKSKLIEVKLIKVSATKTLPSLALLAGSGSLRQIRVNSCPASLNQVVSAASGIQNGITDDYIIALIGCHMYNPLKLRFGSPGNE